MKRKYYNIIFLSLAIIFSCFFGTPVASASSLGDVIQFNVNKNFDVVGSDSVPAVLVKSTPNLHFFVEKSWWDAQNSLKQSEILLNLDTLSTEFSNKIYPTLTSRFGFESKPGIDNDNKISVLFHQIKDGAVGYFRSSDGYSKLQVPDSNEREMVYLAISQIKSPQLKIFLAHEFVHLITFNQKDKIQGVSEDVWLNEARADYSSTIMGYDAEYDGSNLQKRVRDFLNSPSDSLTQWEDKKYDYAVVSLFAHYLVDRYSLNILSDSLKSKLVGIASINEALLKNGAQEDFAQIFTNWTITMILNDCSVGEKYCYLNSNLNNLKLNPALIFLPLTGNSSLSSTNITKNWSGNWQKIIGGNGDLRLEFSSLAGLKFQVPYIVYDKNNSYAVKFLKLDKNGKGIIDIKDFGIKYNSLIILPSLQSKTFGFEGFELTYPYTFTVSITGSTLTEDQELIQNLLDQIESLKRQIAALQNPNQPVPKDSFCQINSNLYLGVKNNTQVTCLQDFLRSLGQSVYPEGFITGYFGNLTKLAVIRFQEKYQIPNTGFVGALTRAKINQLQNGK